MSVGSMNQFPFSCPELQRFLERQWQKIRGIISQDALASEVGGPGFSRERSPEVLPFLEDSRKNAEEASSSNRLRPSVWSGSMDVIVEECTVTDVVSIIDTTCKTLTNLLDAGHGYRKYYVLLLEALVKLLTALRDAERQQSDMLRSSGIFSQLKVSVSITYALVEKVSARQKLLIFVFKFRQYACTAEDPVPQKLREQVSDTKRLLKDVVRSLEIYDRAYNPMQLTTFKDRASYPVPVYGVTKLTIAAYHHRSLLLNGGKVTFFVCDSDINVVFTVQTWLNNPSSFFNTAKRLSASVESNSGKVYDISVPGYPNKEADLQTRTALIVSDCEQAQVRSLLPVEDPSKPAHWATRRPEALLQEDQPGSQESHQARQKYAGELLVHSKPKYQKYRAEIVMSNMVLKLDCIGQTHEVRKLSVEGKKHKTRVWYKCSVELTGEVLAIYRQKRSNRSEGRRDEGVFHTLGIGNHPDLRDIIICSFVAMGVNSFL